MWAKASNTCVHVSNDRPSINGVALAHGYTSISQVQSVASLDYTSRIRTPSLRQIVVFRNVEGFYAAVKLLGIKNDSCGDKLDELCFKYTIQSDESDNFAEFVNM